MTLDELEAILKYAREQPYVDGRTEVKVLGYPIEDVKVILPVVGHDGVCSMVQNGLTTFAITIFPII